MSDLNLLAQTIKTDPAQHFVACVSIFDDQGYLVGTARKDNPTAFGLPGGKVEMGEDFYRAAIRETREETGIDITDWRLTPIFCATDDSFQVMAFYTDIISIRPPLNPNPGEAICRWILPKEFAHGLYSEYAIPFLQALPPTFKKFYTHEAWYQKLTTS